MAAETESTSEEASERSTKPNGKAKSKPTADGKAAPASKASKRTSKSAQTNKERKESKSGKATARPRAMRPYPAVAFKEATRIGEAIWQYAGDKIRRLTLFEKLEASPTSGASRQAITNSGKYGITEGSYQAEWIELTPTGQIACNPNSPPRERLSARFNLAIARVAPFKALYDEYVSKRLAAKEVIHDFLASKPELKVEDKAECVDLFIVNVRDLGLLRTLGGAETLIPIEQALDDAGIAPQTPASLRVGATEGAAASTKSTTEWDTICFYVTPIGGEHTDNRRHSDLFKAHLIEPAVKELGLKVVRADEIDTSGMITTAIIEHIKRSKLVIADLSSHNPNVFYELALRHVCRLPTVQIIQKSDDLPFDLGQVKTIIIDNTDLYAFVPQMATFIADIAATARQAIEDPEHVSNPISVFYPKFWD